MAERLPQWKLPLSIVAGCGSGGTWFYFPELYPSWWSRHRRDYVGQPAVLLDFGGDYSPYVWLEEPIGALPAAQNGEVSITSIDQFEAGNLEPNDSVRKHLSDKRESHTLFVHAEHDVSDNLSVFGELILESNRSLAELGVPQIVSEVPTSNAFNSTGESLLIGYSFDREVEQGLLPRHQNHSEVDSRGMVVGFSAALGRSDWRLDGYLNHSREEKYTRAFDGFDSDALEMALADSDPQTALNLFGGGNQNDPALLAELFRVSDHEFSRPTSEFNSTLQWNLAANGDLMELNGNSVAAAFGVDVRREAKQIEGYQATTLYIDNPKRDIRAAMAEVLVPVVSEAQSLPGIRLLEVRLAGRWVQYRIEGPFEGGAVSKRRFTSFAPTLGVSLRPSSDWNIRASWGESFAAPRLTSLFRAPVEPYNVGWIASSLAGGGVTHDPVTGAEIVEVDFQPVGNPDLEPEASTTWSAGVDWVPGGRLTGFEFYLTYNNIQTTQIAGNSTSLIWEEPERYLRESVFRDPVTDEILLFQSKPINFSSESVKAVDANASYDWVDSRGSWQFGMAATYVLEKSTQFLPSRAPTEQSGTLHGPDRLRLRSWLSWSDDDLSVNLMGNFVSSYSAPRESSIPGNQHIPHYVSYDLTGQWQMPSDWHLNAGIRNLTNSTFPYLDNRTPVDPRRVDIRGRVVYLELSRSYDLF